MKGNVTSFDAEAGTYTTGGNGYIDGRSAAAAYGFSSSLYRSLEYTDSNIPAELRKLLSIKYYNSSTGEYENQQNEKSTLKPYIVFDYTSEIQFRSSIEIPFTLKLDNPWDNDVSCTFTVTIKGVE